MSWLAYSTVSVTVGARVLHLQLSNGSTYRVGTIITSRSRLVILACVTLWMVELFTELEDQVWGDDHESGFGYVDLVML